MENVIKVRGAREHNLKNIDVDIPREKIVVVTGLSGSGKSSLAFDTLYVEGQRRYVESLSAYARLFLGQMDKPDFDSIEGLSPTISIDQKTTSHNPRSTVGTVTEIYDYLRLLFARVGTPHCPDCGQKIEKTTLDQIINQIYQGEPETRLMIMAPIVRGRKGEFHKIFNDLMAQGFVRIMIDGDIYDLSDDIKLTKSKKHDISVIVDRIILRKESRARLADSVELALKLADGLVEIATGSLTDDGNYEYSRKIYSQNFSCIKCGINFTEISPRLFSFNNPIGACGECSGIGVLKHIDTNLIIPNQKLSLNEGAIQASGWRSDEMNGWGRCFYVALAAKYDFSLDTPWEELTPEIQKEILYGRGRETIYIDTSATSYQKGKNYRTHFEGVIPSLERRYRETISEDMKSYYEQYMSIDLCPSCKGARLNKEALSITVGDKNIAEVVDLSISECLEFLSSLSLPAGQQIIADRIIVELNSRLKFLLDVGLSYITLSRSSSTLSGGEAQRIRLATQIGSGLMGVAYVLDEPSIGLHQRDNSKLLSTLTNLRNLGNTVIVVEHDEETMWQADYIIDMGPGAGNKGGEVIACGPIKEILRNKKSLTGQYLSGKKFIPIADSRRTGNGKMIQIKGGAENNLQSINVDLPLGTFICVTGVSGSGKSSLVNTILLRYLEIVLNGSVRKVGKFDKILGTEYLDKVIAIDQSPIGRTPRSNPATYTGTFDLIRALFAETKEAKVRGYAPGRFSFNVKGGRCEACSGDGLNKIEMHFLPDMYVQCEVCKGKRYNRETLNVKYKDKNIADILEMTIDEASEFFADIPRIFNKLQTLQNVGLGYLHLGQPSTQLSGGEAQRIKLASELAKRSTGRTIYILDEPTTGLHIADVHKLIDILHQLVDAGNTVLVIEHNLDVIKTADYIVDLGPEGGKFGGKVIGCGTPEEISEIEHSYTGQYLHAILNNKNPYKTEKTEKTEKNNGHKKIGK